MEGSGPDRRIGHPGMDVASNRKTTIVLADTSIIPGQGKDMSIERHDRTRWKGYGIILCQDHFLLNQSGQPMAQ